MIPELDAVEDVLSGRQTLEQRLGGEIALRQRIDEYALAHVAEAFGGGDLDLHARRPFGARPHHTAVETDVARLYAVGDQRPVVGAADVWPCDAQRGCGRRYGKEFAGGSTSWTCGAWWRSGLGGIIAGWGQGCLPT